ncbi:MAG: ATP-binding protein [Thermodesulfobacteriota bacterium]|nr:ATP-binding protein [Thermodesulfobacteriota bacterium]
MGFLELIVIKKKSFIVKVLSIKYRGHHCVVGLIGGKMLREACGVQKVNIRPGVSILSVLRHLNYRPWYALAEFVDNSVQSFLTNRDKINSEEGKETLLRVDIETDNTDSGRIIIRDNAAGIYESEYARAFRPAEIPPDRTGLCEFGMGMKSAACWFARKWSVRTTALGEPVERTIMFDIHKIVEDRIEELEITTREVPEGLHYTEIILTGLNQVPHGRTLSKIKDHIKSIYRVFLRQGFLCLSFDNEKLIYEDPEIMTVPHYRDMSGPPLEWRKDIEFDFGLGQKAKGFAALRARASTTNAGFALFRRKRLIQGSGDETYRPEYIFGKTNSFRYQRLFGELHLEGFEISHTKDGFRWDENEDVFLDLLKEHLEAPPLNMLEQAEQYRVRASREALKDGAERATERTAAVIERKVPPVIEEQINKEPDKGPPPEELPETRLSASTRRIDVELNGQPWEIIIEITMDPAIGDWITISDQCESEDERKRRRLGIRMSITHPFMDRFCGTGSENMEALLRVAAAIGLAQTVARDAGATMTSTAIRNINELLRNGLSGP